MTVHNAHDPNSEETDVVVIGGGPAGSTAALVLAESGRSVLCLERRALPRFHIGESQLCYTAALLRQLGLYEDARAQGYPVKTGAEFVFPNGDYRRTDFSDQGPGRQPTTFQVERAHFDNFLAASAVKRGARLEQEALVRELLFDDTGRMNGVRYEKDGVLRTVRAAWVLDAGGRASKIAQHFQTRREIPWLRNFAVFRHYKGLDERMNPGVRGDIQVGGHADGWIWAIPIWSDTISVGAVMPREVLRAGTSPESVFSEHLARVPRITERLRGATPQQDLRIESDYNYYSEKMTGPGWMLAGDAANFIDPIFSAGTFLAIFSGMTAGRTLHQIMAAPERSDELARHYSNLAKTGYDSYCRLISAYYESGYKLGAYLGERGFSVEGDPWFARVLSGDFWSDTNPFTEYLRRQQRWNTFTDFEVVRDCPVYPDLDAAERGGLAGQRL